MWSSALQSLGSAPDSLLAGFASRLLGESRYLISVPERHSLPIKLSFRDLDIASS